MDPLQEQTLSRYIHLRDHISGHPYFFEMFPVLQPDFEALSHRLSLILKSKDMFEESDFLTLKEDLIVLASSCCRKLTSYSLLEDIKELQGMFFSPDELHLLSDAELLRICEQISDKYTEYRKDLADYGINDSCIDNLQKLTDRFQTLLKNKQIISDLMEQTKKDFSGLLDEAAKIFDDVLEKHPS